MHSAPNYGRRQSVSTLSEADYQRWPLYWFSRLEAALEAGDLAQAAEAQRRLEELGLRVEPLTPWTREKEGALA
jgi:hypothetical protein